MSPQAREILVNLSMSLAESEVIMFLSDCHTCDRDTHDAECGTGSCGIWRAMDAMSYARVTILDVMEGDRGCLITMAG